MLAALLHNGATLRPLCTLDEEPQSGYRPTAATKASFCGARDMTCRLAGLHDKPDDSSAMFDHTVPYPFGPTHPSNTKHVYAACTIMIKTFIAGGGWALNG